MIRAQQLTKCFGGVTAVDCLDFTVAPGRVTGFLGPNGAGKSTTLRMFLGLTAPTTGSATIGGKRYRELRQPLRTVGAMLDASNALPSRSARAHLDYLAIGSGIDRRRVEEVLERAGIGSAADAPVRTFSLGMRQRLGIAAALLGDPAVLILDEPVNGLDTEGVRWLRGLVRLTADEGRTVLLSSHVMSEMELVADHLLVVGGGRLLADEPMRDFIDRHSGERVRVRSLDDAALRTQLERGGGAVEDDGFGAVTVSGLAAAQVGRIALRSGVALQELTPIRASLEDVYTVLVTSQEVA